MNINMFSPGDLRQIEGKGIHLTEVLNQLDRFKDGFPTLKITSPATIENGIRKLNKEELQMYGDIYERKEAGVVKFVPASGAATRMFKNLFAFLQKFDGEQESLENISREEKRIGKFFTELDEFAFYDELNEKLIQEKGISIAEAKGQYKHDVIVDLLLNSAGLNYGNLPKALLSFHRYENEVRTPAQEHIYEGLAYAEKGGKVHIHFTVSPEHKATFQEHVDNIIERLEASVSISTSFSEQQSDTDTIASTISFQPFRNENGELLFRPAGHGALLENLNSLSSDIIFIKNIDNVVPDHLKKETIRYKKALAGVLIEYQQKTFDLLNRADAGEDIRENTLGFLEEMGIKGDFSDQEIIRLLNRPIRVCGMVKNEGEPGGGPFWVKAESSESLQIVESAQIDKSDKNQRSIFESGTHFNPVDIVCGVKTYRGEKFDLLKYRNVETGFIAEKTHNGEKLLAMELPGLWNGSMADWNTIFIEVPLITFNPVKTVTDLLKPAHR